MDYQWKAFKLHNCFNLLLDKMNTACGVKINKLIP